MDIVDNGSIFLLPFDLFCKSEYVFCDSSTVAVIVSVTLCHSTVGIGDLVW